VVAARGAIGAIVRSEATARGVPVAFALAVAWQESGWQPGVVSRAGAVGVMQLTPPTADWVASTMLGHRIDLYDAHSNIRAGVTLLRHYLDRYHGDRALVLAAYYQGQTAADRHGVYQVTRPYIASISALEKFFAS
jgi:soluble lytic murein transglycosylase-like protein